MSTVGRLDGNRRLSNAYQQNPGHQGWLQGSLVCMLRLLESGMKYPQNSVLQGQMRAVS